MRGRMETANAIDEQAKKYPGIPGVMECALLTGILDVLFDLREQNTRIIELLEVKHGM